MFTLRNIQFTSRMKGFSQTEVNVWQGAERAGFVFTSVINAAMSILLTSQSAMSKVKLGSKALCLL